MFALKTWFYSALFAAAVAVLLGACSPSEEQVFTLEELPLERPELELEWRDAWRVPAGSAMTLPLGEAPEGAVCRVGLLDGGEGNPVDARVYVDEYEVAAFSSSGKHAWHDERIALPRAGASCRLELSAGADFWISHAEVFVPEPASRAVLIFLIDALRQDHLGCYGYPLDTSPNIDAFAQDAVRLTHVTPSTSWTRPSVATLWTSTHPSVHGAEDRPDMLRENLPSLSAQLGAGGLETHCFMTNRNCIPVWGFGHDFHRFRDADTANWVDSDDADVVNLAIETIEDAAGRPWYIYVHTMGPHEPYSPPEAFAGRFERSLYADWDDEPEHREILALYDGEIAYTDEQFGRLIAVMKERKVYEDALIIVLADHGEEFWDHGGIGHGKTLYEEQLRVPFLVKLPGNAHAGEVCNGLAEFVDVAPTILDVVAIEPDPRFQGVSMLGMIQGEDSAKPMAYASLSLMDKVQRAAKTKEHKYIHDIAQKERLWFDLVEDPGETAPLEAPPEEAPPLAQYALNTAMQGASGLHLVVLHEASAARRVTGTIHAPTAESFELRYPESLQEAELAQGTLEFSLNMAAQNPNALMPPAWEKIGKVDPLHNLWALENEPPPDFAHLVLRIEPGDTVTVTVEVDGEPIPSEAVYLGAEGRHVSLEGLEQRVEELAAGPHAFVPSLLPSEFGVYVWYVPPITTVEDHELSSELQEALKNLGY
ncbi:MAG: sulfatase [Candidatus Hydrogenedentota bacterium]